MKPSIAISLFAMALPWCAAVAGEAPAAAGTLIELRVDAQRKAPNDLGRAVVFVEAAGAEPAELARRVKERLADGLAIAKAQAGVDVKSGTTGTWPVYAKGGGAIESWRMRSELVIESADATVLSALVGRLQKTMAVAGITFQPSPEARRRAEEEAELEAIGRFRDKAGRVAAVFKQPYRIRRMSINPGGGGEPPRPMLRAAAMEAMPLEAGESTVGVAVEGEIELTGEPPR